MKFLNFFQFIWVIFALLDPDPDSRSTDLIVFVSSPDPKTLISVVLILLGALAICSLLMGGRF
jgi:hypothetical protein